MEKTSNLSNNSIYFAVCPNCLQYLKMKILHHSMDKIKLQCVCGYEHSTNFSDLVSLLKQNNNKREKGERKNVYNFSTFYSCGDYRSVSYYHFGFRLCNRVS